MSFIENQLKREYRPGDRIFKEGDSGASMFVLLDGTVEITKVIGEAKVVLATLVKGSIFGEMAIINRKPRSATATATANCVALEISRDLFQHRLADVPRWMQAFFEIMAERLRDATAKQDVRTAEDAANQFANILAMLAKQTEADTQDRQVLPWKTTIATAAMLMGVPEDDVNEMANKLVIAKIAKSEKSETGRVLILDQPEQLYGFADFCRNEFLLKKGHIEKMPDELTLGVPHIEKVIECVNAVMESQGALDDFTLETLGKMLDEKYHKPLVYFKDAIDSLESEGVITSFKPDDGAAAYRVNDRDLFTEKLTKLETLQGYQNLRKQLSE